MADGVFGFAGLFDLDEDGGFGGRMAEGEVGAARTGLVFRPDDGGVPRVPTQLLQDAETSAATETATVASRASSAALGLGDGLFVGEPALAQAGDDGGEFGLQGH